jgi:hypothetical protein
MIDAFVETLRQYLLLASVSPPSAAVPFIITTSIDFVSRIKLSLKKHLNQFKIINK